MPAHVEARTGSLWRSVFLICLPSFCLETAALPELEVYRFGLASQCVLGICLHSTHLNGDIAMLGLYVGVGDSNSGAHVCRSSVPTPHCLLSYWLCSTAFSASYFSQGKPSPLLDKRIVKLTTQRQKHRLGQHPAS